MDDNVEEIVDADIIDVTANFMHLLRFHLYFIKENFQSLVSYFDIEEFTM